MGKTETGKRRHIAIVGAGPIGLEAALHAVDLGHRVDVYERGTIADNVRRWGHIRLFSPFGMNASEAGQLALKEIWAANWTLETPIRSKPEEAPEAQLFPADNELLTGFRYIERYLLPLSRLSRLTNCIHQHVEVLSIARSQLLKRDLIGKPERRRDPFRLLLRNLGREYAAHADYVLDCSGTFGNHNWAGAGGMPAIGETSALTLGNYLLPDICDRERERFAGKTTLVVGSGYSAATSIAALAQLAESVPNTRAIWVTRSNRAEPIEPIQADKLPERASLTRVANRLATAGSGPVEWRAGRLIDRIERSGENDGFRLGLLNIHQPGEAGREEISVDNVIANVGYRPDSSLCQELQVQECYASQGVMKLAAVLLGQKSPDCMAQPNPGPQVLVNPEPGFFILGAKSYGRNSKFLINIGLQQIRSVFSLISSDPDV